MEEIELLRESASCIGSQEIKPDAIQTSPDGQGFTRMIDRAADMERELMEEIARLNEMRHERISMIQQLDSQYSELLFQRYVLGKDLWYIAQYMGRSYGRIRNLHSEALEAFAKKFLENLEK